MLYNAEVTMSLTVIWWKRIKRNTLISHSDTYFHTYFSDFSFFVRQYFARLRFTILKGDNENGYKILKKRCHPHFIL